MMSPSLRFSRIAFTGKLGTLTPQQAAEAIRQSGATLATNISRLTNFLVIGMKGWPLLPDGSVSAKLRRAEELNERGARIEIISEVRFLELASLRPLPAATPKEYSREEVCRSLNIDPGTLQRWEHFGLVRAREGRYDFQDLVSLQTVAELVQRGVKIEAIAASLHHLGATLPGVERPLAQLKIVAEHSSAILADLGRFSLAPSGQLCFNFDPAAAAECAVVELEGENPTATEWFQAGQAYEEAEQYDQAARAYGKATALEPACAEAHFNLGNVLRVRGEHKAALHAYRRAIEADGEMACAWYNLADLQEHLGLLQEAVASLHEALRVCPNFADAHFNLAACLEQLGWSGRAEAHWRAYVRLDPNSTWADIARRHLIGVESTGDQPD